MENLLEQYKQRIAVAEKVYSRTHMNESLSEQKKLVTARCLDNLTKFMNEAFNNSVGTQRSDLGLWKKFTLNLTNVALPNLIAYDLVIVQAMSSMSGYITYIQYTAGTNKGQTRQGDVFNNPFKLGNVDVNYTSERVVETVTTDANGKATLAWAPVINTAEVKPEVVGVEGVTITVDDAKTGAITFVGSDVASTEFRVRYVYDNVVIPQNDLPILNAEIKSIPLVATARRIAIYYSQIAAFQAKTDYGFDLGDQLAEKAVGQLNYEIDTEVTQLLIDNAESDDSLVWSKTLPVGVSKFEHYEGFIEVLEQAKMKIYDRTKRFSPNYMLVSSTLMPVLSCIKSFNSAPASTVNGPYFAGTINNLKVYVTPNIEANKFVIGVNGNDMMSSAAVFAPYMPVVPTQLLGYADGGMSTGWSTMYALELLNKDLLVAGRITA